MRTNTPLQVLSRTDFLPLLITFFDTDTVAIGDLVVLVHYYLTFSTCSFLSKCPPLKHPVIIIMVLYCLVLINVCKSLPVSLNIVETNHNNFLCLPSVIMLAPNFVYKFGGGKNSLAHINESHFSRIGVLKARVSITYLNTWLN